MLTEKSAPNIVIINTLYFIEKEVERKLQIVSYELTLNTSCFEESITFY